MIFNKLSYADLVKELDKHKFKQLHIHHTWKPDHSNFTGDNYLSMQNGMRNYHMKTNKWSDIGQHLTLFPDGVWLTGRPFGVTPASIKGWNTGALCVEMIGNFDKGNDVLKGEQEKQIIMLIRYFIDKYGAASVKFHRENSPKTCPGTSLDKGIMLAQARELYKASPKPEGYKLENIKLDIHNQKKEVKGIVKDGINYVPIRLLEDLGYKITWDAANRVVVVKYK